MNRYNPSLFNHRWHKADRTWHRLFEPAMTAIRDNDVREYMRLSRIRHDAWARCQWYMMDQQRRKLARVDRIMAQGGRNLSVMLMM